MGKRRSASEAGQAIILIALVTVGLIAMMGLAIDGGGLYLLRRDTQNAVDAAIIAATYAQCTNGDFVAAGRRAAAKNGYTDVDGINVTDMSDGHDVEVNNPPTQGSRAGDDEYVEVIIRAEKPKYFIQLVYGGPMEITTRGVGKCNIPRNPYDFAIVAMGAGGACPGDWIVNSTGSSQLFKGGVSANGGMKLQGANAVVEDGDVFYHENGTFSSNNGTFETPPATQPTVTYPPLFDIADYQPGGVKAVAAGSDYHSYTSDQTFNGTLSGLIYVDGDVQINKGTVADTGIGVTIVATGEIQISNNVKNTNWRHYDSENLLFFSTHVAGNPCSSGGGNDGIKVAGSQNQFTGIIYAPSGKINISGSEINICGAVIGTSVNPSASDSTFDKCNVFPPPPRTIQNSE